MRAVIYTRVSTKEQAVNYSLDTQERACIEYCERRGISIDKVFREEGESAKSTARPRLQEMLTYCAENSRQIDLVVVYRVDRLARQVHDHHVIKLALQSVGIALRAVQETFDDSPMGMFMESVMAAVAQLDNDQRAARTKDGMRTALTQGRWLWRAPIGYFRSPMGPSLVPDAAIAPLVTRAFEECAAGYKSRNQVLEELTAIGLGRNGKPLSPQAFGSMLRNPIYTGRVVSAGLGVDAQGDFEPLTSPEIFASVQGQGDAQSSHNHRRSLDHPDFPLRRVVHCGDCNAPLTASWSRGRSSRYGYYRCPRKGCGRTKSRKEHVEASFLEVLARLTARRQVVLLLGEVVRDAWQERQRADIKSLKEINSMIATLEGQKQRLLEAYLYEKRLNDETYNRELIRLEGLISQTHAQRTNTHFTSDALDFALHATAEMLMDLPGYWNRLKTDERPAFLRAVFPDGLVLSGDTLGTTENACFFWGSALPDTGESSLAAPSILDWNRIYSWIELVQILSPTPISKQKMPNRAELDDTKILPPFIPTLEKGEQQYATEHDT